MSMVLPKLNGLGFGATGRKMQGEWGGNYGESETSVLMWRIGENEGERERMGVDMDLTKKI